MSLASDRPMNVTRTLHIVAVLVGLALGVLPTSTLSASRVPIGASAALTVSGEPKGDEKGSDAQDIRLANEILERLRSRYRYLDGVTVSMGETPAGEEAVAYYTEGRIVIDRDHTVNLRTVLAHEIWHVVDWRDNGRLDWGESLPPENASVYLKE